MFCKMVISDLGKSFNVSSVPEFKSSKGLVRTN